MRTRIVRTQVRVQGLSANEFVGKRPQAVWKLVKKHLEDNGTDKEKEVAKGWNSITLHNKFGLGSKEVRKRIEGLSGAMDCFKYKFMEEATCAPNAVGAESKSKKPKISMLGRQSSARKRALRVAMMRMRCQRTRTTRTTKGGERRRRIAQCGAQRAVST